MTTTTGRGVMPPAEWNDTARDYPEAYAHEAFSAQVARDPSAPAVRFRDERLTYGELDARVGRLAGGLAARGVAPGTLVAVCMYRSLEMVVALHAILRAGAAYVPIDPEYPDQRIEMMLDDLDGPLLLTQSRLMPRFAQANAVPWPIDGQDAVAARTSAVSAVRVAPDDLVYVIHTSGSTGRPKGVMITHRAIRNRMNWLQERFGMTPADKVLQKTPFSFDPSVWEFLWPLQVGAELVVAEPGGHRDARYVIQMIIEHGITTIHSVPSMLQLLLEDPRISECRSLKRVICSGEVLTRALQDRFFSQLGAELHNLYGPSEAIGVSAWACDRDSSLTFVPVGTPVANTQLYILDEEQQRVPVGDVGELYIGGVQVGRGYLNDPRLTSERFLPDPFQPGGVLYRSGDLARYLPDGNLEFVGRTDFQVKIRGNRVELGEVEAAIEAVDGVRGTLVVAHDPTGEELELAAYVAIPQDDGPSVEEIASLIAARLPEYMIPSLFIRLERFPLTDHGKVDRRALPPPIRVRPRLERPFAAPRTDLQRTIAELWRRTLNLDRVGIDDRFFELGGTSLQAARFVAGMQATVGEPISVVSLFDAPTVAEYAAFLEQRYPTMAVGASLTANGAGAPPDPAPDPAPVSQRPRSSLSRQRARRRSDRSQIDD